MQASQIPSKFQKAFASGAAAGNIRAIPVTTSDPNAASETLGWPPSTLTAEGAGGVAPDGRDMNGLDNQLSAWALWFSIGGPVTYDATQQTAIGGYPKGAVVASALTFGVFWLCTADNNTSNPDTGGTGWVAYPLGVQPGGGAQLQWSSATSLLLAPQNGGYLWINGFNQAIPSNLNLSNIGLAASTLYYVYAYMNSGAMTLEAATTGYVLNTTTGIPQKAGDVTRTLVGMAFTDTAIHFNDNAALRNVASWFNQRDKKILGLNPPGSFTTASPAYGEFSSTWRVELVCWAKDNPTASINGSTSNNTQGGTLQNWTAFGLDGAVISTDLGVQEQEPTTLVNSGIAVDLNAALAEGHHVLTVYGKVTGIGSLGNNTGTWSSQIIGNVRN